MGIEMREKKYSEYRTLGSNAVVTERPLHREEQKRQKELKKIKLNRRIKQLEIAREQRKSIIQVAVAILVTGIITIGGNSSLYAMQNQVSDLNAQINELKSDNEALNLKLLKVASLDNIKNVAENQLGMINQDTKEVVRYNLSVNNFPEENGKNEEQSIFAKIKDALF